ncbi:uncharacterized protein LOC119230692 isoform X2 [Talpa occidentalis]|uniref:uncharacterized protein LOC119230692 isoform X2 n=1 Tax=Talpa occidentalis TaxID=50954 RepID=UPI0023F7EE2D|nr:uncharacterized protein LOC119230692 isoform X2 [Talpa occidentalis]
MAAEQQMLVRMVGALYEEKEELIEEWQPEPFVAPVSKDHLALSTTASFQGAFVTRSQLYDEGLGLGPKCTPRTQLLKSSCAIQTMENYLLSLKSAVACGLSFSCSGWVTDTIFIFLCGWGLYFLLLACLQSTPSLPPPRRDRNSRKKSILDCWLDCSFNCWVTDTIFVFLCGLGLFFLILPCFKNDPSLPTPRKDRNIRKHQKELKARDRSREIRPVLKGVRDFLRELEEARKLILLLQCLCLLSCAVT